MVKFRPVLVWLLAVVLTGCSSSSPTPDKDYTWQVQVIQAEVKSALKTTENITLYTGNKDQVLHENNPSSGNTFLILKLKISKAGEGDASFEWKNLAVQDSAGSNYPRLGNDSFIEQHGYAPRLTGLPIRFGENEGWVGFEIPVSASSGKLYLEYGSSEGSQKTEIKP
jgi:hypothetical protein